MNEELKLKLDKLINQYKVMLFMKWTPEMPSCWFSSKAVQILLDSDIYFESFDIYSDEEIRQWLKLYKSWPTYPQLYINWELVWGVDIMIEMFEEWEFEEIKKSL